MQRQDSILSFIIQAARSLAIEYRLLNGIQKDLQITGLSFQEYRNIMKIRSDKNISQDHRNRKLCGSSRIQFLRNRLIFPGQAYIFSPNNYPQSNFNSKAQSDQKVKNNLFENESMNN